MKKTRIIHAVIMTLMLTSMGSMLFTSCQETEEVEEFDNWKERNEAFIDSIARICDANADGRWMKYLSFKLNEKDINGATVDWGNEHYVYCHRKVKGSGTVSPLFTDTVACNYRGRLIPTISYPEGYVFAQSYKGKTIDPEVNVPTPFSVGSLVVGWSTVVQYMHVGDTWRIYIPAELGYGSLSQDKKGIPAHSTLVFDVHLADIRHTVH
jgi:FKBP-type peptidyl-prolyl cis-trans isomerase FklB